MKYLHPFVNLLGCGLFLFSCQPEEAPTDLTAIAWIHGSDSCSKNTDPPFQVLQVSERTWMLRQDKCVHYEAPFLYLFAGDKKALLMDTGAMEDVLQAPIYETVKGVLSAWEQEKGYSLDLIVAHTHSHSDHTAADGQFRGKPKTTVVGTGLTDVITFFNFQDWPSKSSPFDLGGRVLDIIPIPGHDTTAIAVFDPETRILLTGDSFYPGRLYIEDWKAFVNSTQRLVDFVEAHDVVYMLGNHIEMNDTPRVDYPIGTTYQPSEASLPLFKGDLLELNTALLHMGDSAFREIHDKFIIYPK